jgi:hypothetical protein
VEGWEEKYENERKETKKVTWPCVACFCGIVSAGEARYTRSVEDLLSIANRTSAIL